jgi:asparagine synthase (glutamine-hydrolysing)
MVSADENLILVLNGEIYNHLEIRQALAQEGVAPSWKGHSDTETLLAAISAWGLPKSLQISRGMFAMGLWNREAKILMLARDRVGEKPIYYGKVESSFVFASELKAFREIPGYSPQIDRGALALMLRYGYVPCPHSIYRGIYKLPPGTILQVKADGSFGEPEEWWSFRRVVQKAKENKLELTDSAAADQLEAFLGSAVREQMVADVPLGALLSGGIDSSLVVALMQAQSRQPVRTFTIGFEEKEYDESSHAQMVSRHLGTHHTELQVTPGQALEVIPRLPDIYDEPFADASQIPTALVCELTQKHVTVALSGDAGDELFGGYNRHFWAPSFWEKIKYIPPFARAGIASAITAFPATGYNRIERTARSLLTNSLRVSHPGDKLHKLAAVLSASSRENLYQNLVNQWRGPLPLLSETEPPSLVSDASRWPATTNFSEQMMAVDTLTYLPDDILVKVDRAAMAVGLETRVPFLDERIIHFAWQLPLNDKIRGKNGKWVLRQLLSRHLPKSLFLRPKQGFGVPLESWLRGPLRGWAEDLIAHLSRSSGHLLNMQKIRAAWRSHLSGKNMQYALWPILMFGAWANRWKI